MGYINGKIRMEEEAIALREDQGAVEQCHAHTQSTAAGCVSLEMSSFATSWTI